MTMLKHPAALSAALSLSFPSLVTAFSFEFTSTPKQCSDLSVKITGSDGKPPYRILIVPFGATTLANNVEARTIYQSDFSGNDDNLTFKLNYPVNSQFVAVVSDSSGFGAGGSSAAATVQTSSDSSCYDSSTSVSPNFYLNIDPPNQIVQCSSTRIWWDKSKVQGNTQFQGVIPGGESFEIPVGSTSDVASQGTGFNWTPSVRGGTTLIIVGGDSRGPGNGGSVINTVSFGTNPDNSCLNGTSPSSTPGSPAGGSYPTTTGATSGNNGSKTNVGAIVGGVVGGVAGIVVILLILLFFYRRRRLDKQQREKPVDLLQGDEGDGPASGRPENAQYYQPEPFVMPEPSADGHTNPDIGEEGSSRPLSGRTSTTHGPNDMLGVAATSASGSSNGRKSAAGMRPLRPVNIVQHDDAGAVATGSKDEEPETVELPPAYTNIRS